MFSKTSFLDLLHVELRNLTDSGREFDFHCLLKDVKSTCDKTSSAKDNGSYIVSTLQKTLKLGKQKRK